MPKSLTWIVKLGGALIGQPSLLEWIKALTAAARSHRIVVVAGGGVFADTVRRQQPILGIDDATAHHMAILAMRQFALALSHKFSAYGYVPTLSDVSALRVGQTSSGLWLWDPCDPLLEGAELAQDWTVSSDSLALWLSGELAGSALVLVKHDRVALSAPDGAVDAYFSRLEHAVPSRVEYLGWSRSADLSLLIGDRD